MFLMSWIADITLTFDGTNYAQMCILIFIYLWNCVHIIQSKVNYNLLTISQEILVKIDIFKILLFVLTQINM